MVGEYYLAPLPDGGGRITVEWVAECSWNRWPDHRGLGGRMCVDWVAEWSRNTHETLKKFIDIVQHGLDVWFLLIRDLTLDPIVTKKPALQRGGVVLLILMALGMPPYVQNFVRQGD
jgi:hypothetical protein